MASAFDGVDGIHTIASLPKEIEILSERFAASKMLNDQARIALDTSKRKMERWKFKWLSDANDATTRSEALWGAHAWKRTQDQLAAILSRIEQLQAFEQENAGPGIEKRPSWGKGLKWAHPKRSHQKTPPISLLALALDEAVETLWTYSEMIFGSLPVVAEKTLCPPSHDWSLENSIKVRPVAFLVYEVLRREKSRFGLKIDLLEKKGASRAMDYRGPLIFERIISYQLIDMIGGGNDILIQALANQEKVASTADSKTCSDPFEIMRCTGSYKPDISYIQPEGFGTVYLLSLDQSQLHTSEGRSLAALLRVIRTSDEPEPRLGLSLLSRFVLAFKLAEFVEYLLGTPLLVSLGSERIFECGFGDTLSFAVRVPTLSLEKLYLEDPEALSEPSQLFNFGVLLIEIAIGKLDKSGTQSVRDPYRWASDLLPDVHKALGPEYSKACGFCIEDRRSTSSFRNATKYEQPAQNGWNKYLRDLLKTYHIQVVHRFVTF